MAKMSLEDLRKLRKRKKDEKNRRDAEGKNVEVIIGMGTCGIAAGAKECLGAFLEEFEKGGLKNAAVKQAGCMGLCYVEPTVEVHVPGMPDTIYGNIDADVVKLIVEGHILGKTLVNNHIFDRPAADIFKEGGDNDG